MNFHPRKLSQNIFLDHYDDDEEDNFLSYKNVENLFDE